MNARLFPILLLSALIASCGVKGAPLPPLPEEERLREEQEEKAKLEKRDKQRKLLEERRKKLQEQEKQGR